MESWGNDGRLRFESWGDYVAQAEAYTPTTESEAYQTVVVKPGGFHQTETFAGAVKLAWEGWQEGADRIGKLASRLTDTLSHQVERDRYTYDVEGVGFDMARVLDGDPDCWVQRETFVSESRGRIVKISLNGTVSGGVKSDVIEARGAAVTALVQCLELAGFETEIVVAFHSQDYRGTSYQCDVNLKPSGQPLDLPRVAFALAHPDMLRRLMFAHWDNAPKGREFRGAGYGTPREVSTDADVAIGSMTYGDARWASVESATAWIKAELSRLGVELKG